MASLVQWLSYSGARRVDGTPVASGKAYFYVPGTTSSPAVVYSDADGLLAITQPITLDASGRAEVYVKTAVRCEVQDITTTPATVTRVEDRANTVNATQVEVENTAATGTDLVTGSQVAGGRTDLNTFLTNLRTSLGAADGQVLVSGVGQNIKDVIGNTSSIFFNVRVAPYGAVGDDSTDDTAAIQTAINAAGVAGGGIIYFPPGTYKLTDNLQITSSKIHFLGVTPGATIFKQYANTSLNITATDFICENINFAMGAGGVSYITSSSTNDSRFVACSFSTTLAGGAGQINVSTSGSRTTLIGCTFIQSNATGNMFSVGNASAIIAVVGGRISLTQPSTQSLVTGTAGTVIFTGMEINHSAASGTTNLVVNTAGVQAAFVGCCFPNTGGATLRLAAGVTGQVTETGCFPLSNVLALANVPALTNVNMSATRAQMVNRVSSAVTSYAPDFGAYAAHDITTSGASFQWSTPTGYSFSVPGPYTVRYKNNTGGAITPTFAAAYKIGAAPSVAAGASATWSFLFDVSNNVFIQVGANSISFTA